jgi:hypothetical protein
MTELAQYGILGIIIGGLLLLWSLLLAVKG